MKRTRRFWIAMLMMSMVILNGITLTTPFILESTSEEVEPYSDKIIWRYRQNSNGKRQKRRWNATVQKWVDPEWIDC